MLNISIKAEPIFEIFGFPLTNSLFTSVIVLILLILLARYYDAQLKKRKKSTAFYVIHFFIAQIYNLFEGVLHDKITVFFPLVGAFFFYILMQNWFGLLPGVGSLLVYIKEHGESIPVPLFRGAAADLNTTLAFGLISVIAMQYYGIKYLGFGEYIKKYINARGVIDFMLGLLEIISEISRVASFSFRLFGNIFAGEVLLMVIAFLLPSLVSFVAFPFFTMELFVGFIQALVFAMLTAVFLSMAVSKHH